MDSKLLFFSRFNQASRLPRPTAYSMLYVSMQQCNPEFRWKKRGICLASLHLLTLKKCVIFKVSTIKLF